MKSQRGITLMALAVTIIIMIILTFTIIVNFSSYGEQTKKSSFETDLLSLDEEIKQYYSDNKELPVSNKFAYSATSNFDGVRNINDGDVYYVIDLNKIDVNLRYGKDFSSISGNGEITNKDMDIYIVNAQSFTVYYPKGLTYYNETHYRLDTEYSKLRDSLEDADVYEVALDNKASEVPGLTTTSGTTSIYEHYLWHYSITPDGEKMTSSDNNIIIPTRELPEGATEEEKENTELDFTGYYTQENGEGIRFIDEKGYITHAADPGFFTTNNGTLYANWETSTFMIELDSQGAETQGTGAIYESYGKKYSVIKWRTRYA